MKSNTGNKNIFVATTGLSFVVFFFLFSFLIFNLNKVHAQTDNLINFTGKVTNTDGSELSDGNYDFVFTLYDDPTSGSALWTETLSSSTRFSATISAASSTANGITYTYTGEGATTTFQIGQYLSLSSTSESALITDFDTASRTVSVATGSPLWSVGQGINNRPFVEGGVININLGSVNDFSSVDFSNTLFLEVNFNSEIMQPRKRLTTVNQAFDTINFGGKQESEYATLAEDEIVTGEWTFNNIVSVATSSSQTALTITQNGSGNIIEVNRGATTSFAVANDGSVQFENYSFPLANGAPGYILKATAGGQLEWAVDFASAFGIDGRTLWATSTNDLVVYPIDTSYVVTIGNNATTSPYEAIFEVSGLSWFDDIGVSQGQTLRLYDADSSNYIALRSTSTQSGNFTLTLPDGVGSDGQALVTDGSGNLRWDSPTSFIYNSAGQAGQLAYYATDGSLQSGTSSIFISPSGYFGLATTTPQFLFSLGTSTDNQFVIDEYGRIQSGAWQGDVISLDYGGIGTTTFAANSVLFAPSANTVGEILAGTEGYVLKMNGGVPTWQPDSTVGGESTLWATSSDELLIRPSTVSHVVVVGAGATTSAMSNLILEVAGNSYFGGTISAQNLSLANALSVSSGGTGTSTPTGILVGDGIGNIVSIPDLSSDWSTAFSWGDHSAVNYFNRDVHVATVAIGGTGTSTFEAYSLVYASAEDTIGEILAGGEGEVLKMVGGVPTWSATSSGGAHPLLGSDHNDVQAGAVVQGDLITGQDTGSLQWARLALSPAGYILRSDGNDVAWSTTSAITTLGTITNGAWQADVITETYGGTGQSSWTQGDIVFATATDDLVGLTIGQAGYVLQAVNGRPAWVSTTSLGINFGAIAGALDTNQGGTGQDSSGWNGMVQVVSGTWGTVNGASNQVAYWSDANTLAGENQLDPSRGGTGQDFSSSDGFLYFDSGSAIASSVLAISYTDLAAGAGLSLSANTMSLDATGDWTGTLDSYEAADFFLLNTWYATTTDALTEGSNNLFYDTNLFAADLNGTSTDALSEGAINKYYNTLLFASDLSGTTTDALAEGSTRLYWTQSRFDTAFGLKSTSDLSEGSNLYYTTTRFSADFDATSTDALSEGSSNFYYTEGRFAADLAATTTDALAEGGSRLYWTDDRFDIRLAATTSLTNLTSLANLDTVGTITSGTWQGDTIAVAQGGTGITGITNQSLLYASNDNVIGEFAVGAEGEVLVVSGGALTWASTSPTAAHGLLSVTHSDVTSTSTLIRGDLMVADSSDQWSRLALGNTGYVLYSDGTDAYWSTTTAITSLGIVTQGTWRGDVVELAYGGTGASTATGARENLDLDEIHKFGINSTGTDGYIWQSDGDGRGRWVSTSSLGIAGNGGQRSMFVGTTTYTTNGDFASSTEEGYEAGNFLCDYEYPGSHMCRIYDLIISIEQGIDLMGSNAWVAEGPPGYLGTNTANDCYGWKAGSDTNYGAFWLFQSGAGGGEGWLAPCDQIKPLMCCEYQQVPCAQRFGIWYLVLGIDTGINTLLIPVSIKY